MPKARNAFESVRKIGLALPGVEEGTVFRSPALKVKGRMFACIAIHRSAEPETLAVRVPFKERDRLIAAEPQTYYLTDHYVNYPVVLVRLGQSSREALSELLHASWTFVSSGAKLGARR